VKYLADPGMDEREMAIAGQRVRLSPRDVLR
jgi:hypothetical protein